MVFNEMVNLLQKIQCHDAFYDLIGMAVSDVERQRTNEKVFKSEKERVRKFLEDRKKEEEKGQLIQAGIRFPKRKEVTWNVVTEAVRKYADNTGSVKLTNEVICFDATK